MDGLTRAEVIRGIVACEAIAKRLRARVAADAEQEFTDNETVPSWRIAGVNVVGSTKQPSVAVADEAAFVEWVAERYPTEVEIVRRVRPAWLSRFLEEVVGRGDPPCDAEGEEVPGLEWRPGGAFNGISFRVDSEVKALAAAHADEIADGVRPLALPSGVTR